MKTDKPLSADLAIGAHIHHAQSSKEQIISRRKPDGTGWWLTDGSGIADYAFDSSDEWHRVEGPR